MSTSKNSTLWIYSYEKVWCCISSCFHMPTPLSFLRNIISYNHHSPQEVLATHLTIICLKIKGLLHCHQLNACHQPPKWKFHTHVYSWIYVKIQIYFYILFWMTSCPMMMCLITMKFSSLFLSMFNLASHPLQHSSNSFVEFLSFLSQNWTTWWHWHLVEHSHGALHNIEIDYNNFW
jgi:hypothetical protein